MKEIEKEYVQRSERAEDAARHYQQQHIKFFFARLISTSTGGSKSHDCAH